MGGVIYPDALRGRFLGDASGAGFCGGKLDFPDRRARGGNPHSCASTPNKEGADFESKAGNHSACSG